MISNISAKQVNSSMLVLSVILMFLMATVSSRSVQQAKTYYELTSDLGDKTTDETAATGAESETTALMEELLRRLIEEQSLSSASSASLEDTEKFREVRERKPSIDKYRKMLQGLIRKGSLYNTLPIDADLFDQYMSSYAGNEKRHDSKLKRLTNTKVKKAACGQLTGTPKGSPVQKWMCW